MDLKLRMTGILPLIMHNGQLSNPFNKWSRAIADLSGKKKKTEEELLELAKLEFRGSMYETPDGMIGFPHANVWRCLKDAGKNWRLGESITRALIYDPVNVPILIDGAPIKCDKASMDLIFYRTVKLGQKRIMRARVMVPEGWVIETSFTLTEKELALESLDPKVFDRAGEMIGLGDWRPIYGKFQCEVL